MEATMDTTGAGRNYRHEIGYVDALKLFFQNYIKFDGRSNRGEYWKAALLNLIISIVLSAVDGMLGIGVLGAIWSLATLVPGIAIGVRRLHDIDKSGWWMLLALIPIVGIIILIVWFAKAPENAPNRFG
jgi:uncharacterized membrane protein YhaH (DUF805 family)